MSLRHKKWWVGTAIVLLCVLVATVLLEPVTSKSAFAETVTLKYNIAESQWNPDKKYIGHKTLTTNNLLGKAGYTIKEVKLYKGGTLFKSLDDAVGQTSYTVQETLTGKDVPVYSNLNRTAQGFYAWYRYSKVDGRDLWYANFERLGPSYNSYGAQRSCYAVEKDEFGMSKYPTLDPVTGQECYDTNLALVGSLENRFNTDKFGDGLWVEKHAVDRTRASGIAVKDTATLIPGPEPELIDPGSMKEASIIGVYNVDLTYNYDIVVRFGQRFNFLSEYAANLPAYGAKLMVYYTAFTVNVEAYTYEYPYTLEVVYEPAAKPDLVPVGITTDGSVKIDGLMTYTVKFKNQGVPVTNTPFRVNVKNIATGTTVFDKSFSSADTNQVITDTFTYTATNPQKVRFGLYVDYGTGKGAIDEGDSGGELNNYAEYEFPVNIGIDGDFDLVPPTIKYTDNFQIVPKPFEIPSSCTYRYHQYRFTQNGIAWTTPNINGRNVQTAFNYPNYPDNLSIGTTMVALQIYTSCGDSGWIRVKPFVVQPSDKPNTPPEFRAGFFQEPNRAGTDPVSTVVLGSHVNLRIIEDPTSSPPSPYDAEKDYPIQWNWDFAGGNGNWLKSLPARYGLDNREDRFYNLKADELGNFSIRVTGTDRRGEASSRMVYLNVIPPNPIAVCSAPTPVKANRPVDQSKFIGTNSYSPTGAAIDHSRDEWVNRQATYSNTTGADITVQVQLWVNDSNGLRSLSPATCPIIVKPDQPPIGKLDVPPLGLRGHAYELFNKSYSPDADVLVSAAYRYKYDAANNGFQDDPWQALMGTMTKVSFTPSRVGKYLFDVTVCEDGGRCADASVTQPVTLLVLDTINMAPNVSFNIFGKNQQPEVTMATSYDAASMMTWDLYESNSTSRMSNRAYSWSNQNGVLTSGLGKGMERYYPLVKYTGWGAGTTTLPFFRSFMDGGFGPNNMSPYRGIDVRDGTKSGPVLLPPMVAGKYVVKTPIDPSTPLSVMQFNATEGFYPGPTLIQTTKTHIFFKNDSTWFVYNKSRVPKYEAKTRDYADAYGIHTVLEHRWADGVNPYDLVFSQGDASSKIKQLFGTREVPYREQSGAQYTRTTEVELGTLDPVLTGNQFLVFYSWRYATYCSQEEDTPDENGNPILHDVCTYEPDKSSIAVFDSVTGDMVRTGQDNISSTTFPIGSFDKAFVRGNNLLRFGTSSLRYVEWDSHNNIVSQGQFSLPNTTYTGKIKAKDFYGAVYDRNSNTYSCTWGMPSSPEFYDDVGNIYVYRIMTCEDAGGFRIDATISGNEVTPAGLFLIKYDFETGVLMKSQRLAGKSFTHGNMDPYDQPQENNPFLAINPFTDTAYVRSFTERWSNGAISGTVDIYYQIVDLNTGNVYPGPAVANRPENFSSPFYLTPTGTGPGWCVYTASGSCEMYSNFSGVKLLEKQDPGVYNAKTTNSRIYGQFVGDGAFLSMYSASWHQSVMGNSNGGTEATRWIFLDFGTPKQEAFKGFRLGQWVSPTAFENNEIEFTMNMEQAATDSDLAGFSFRMQDPQNRYAVEMDGTNLYLSRYMAGNRAVLSSIHFAGQNRTDYSFKIKASGDKLEVSVNGVPYFEVTDGTFASGKIGPYSDKSFVGFKSVRTKGLPKNNIEWLTGYAIWEDGIARAEVRYENITYTDPENDPRAGSNKWTITHAPKFLNNHGVSTMHGQSFTTEQLYFDKVGEYWITLRARDDPHPDYLYPSGVFDSYRKDSNAYAKRLIVHRRPVAVMSAWASPDGTIGYSDASYDPDRWINAGTYSPPDTTGIDYGATRGIMERKYYYVNKSTGQYVDSKLTRPTAPGEYEVGLMVRDEYGAWSYPVSATVTVGVIPPVNDRPTATLTYPNGSQASPNLIHTIVPTVTWDQHDTPGTIFQGYHVKISDESGAIVLETGERTQWTSSNQAAWPVSRALTAGIKYQVQVRVSDGELWSEWSNIGWMIVSGPPTASLVFPDGQSVAAPTIIQGNRRPTIQWNQYDPDLPYGEIFQQYSVRVVTSTGALIYDYSGGQWTQSTSQSMTVTTDLPTGVPLAVAVRVFDGYEWSPYSNMGWMLINMPPTADITYPSGTQASPTIEGPTPTFSWNQTDPDPGTIFLKYQLHVVNEANTAVIYDSGEVSQNTSATAQSHLVGTALPAGEKLRVRARVFDGYVWSAWSSDKWLLINRPPLANFDWSPKPIWEGDTVYLDNLSTDPDGNALTSVWEIRKPNGDIRTYGTMDAVEPFTHPGSYTVTLTVSDGFAASSATKVLEALPLTIRSEVNHTPEWAVIHSNKGHNTTTVPKDFYSGEIFVVGTVSSPAPVAEAIAWIDTIGIDGSRLAVSVSLVAAAGDGTRFEGRLFDDKFMSATEGIPLGVLPIHFRIRYTNGVVRTEDVPVNMIGNANDAVDVHRRQ